MLRKLTGEAWTLYLKILDVECISIKHEQRIHRLTNQIYYRYVRRRNAMELQVISGRVDIRESR